MPSEAGWVQRGEERGKGESSRGSLNYASDYISQLFETCREHDVCLSRLLVARVRGWCWFALMLLAMYFKD